MIPDNLVILKQKTLTMVTAMLSESSVEHSYTFGKVTLHLVADCDNFDFTTIHSSSGYNVLKCIDFEGFRTHKKIGRLYHKSLHLKREVVTWKHHRARIESRVPAEQCDDDQGMSFVAKLQPDSHLTRPRLSHPAHVSRQLQACHQYVILFCSSEWQSSGSFDTGSLLCIQISSAGAVRLCSRRVDTADRTVTSGTVCSAKGEPL